VPQRIASSIYVVRGQRVMLDVDLAAVYSVTTSRLNEHLRRNAGRFPEDFMFRLTVEEAARLRSQFATSNGRGGRRYLPYAFTEHGAIMMATVLNTPAAVAASVYVVRSFVRLREMAITQTRLAHELDKLRSRVDVHDASINAVMEVIGDLLGQPDRSRKRIGFTLDEGDPGSGA